MKIYTLSEILEYTFHHSPFYQEQWKVLPSSLAEIPLTSQEHFWRANNLANNQLLTHKGVDGMVFKSGGTTGHPKFSYFSKEEWETFTTIFGQGMNRAGFKNGQKVANLFYCGDLYASFIFIMKSIDNAPFSVTQFPIAGATAIDKMVKHFEEFKIDTLAIVPTTLMDLVTYLENHAAELSIRNIFFGGESLYPDQEIKVRNIFPNAKISSIGYASVDAGHLGFVDETCSDGEHRVFSASSIMEIIDEETDLPIHEKNKIGKLTYTNLTRLLMPIIRYPVGDRAMWTDDSIFERKFKLMGRSDEGARIGPVTVYREDVADSLASMLKNFPTLSLNNFQLEINRTNGLDELIICAVIKNANQEEMQTAFTQSFKAVRPMYYDLVEAKKILPAKLKIISENELVKNERTGKLRLIIDRRF